MLIKRTLNLLTLFLLYFCSCTAPLVKQTDLLWPGDADIYVAGDDSDVATYWKNGVTVHLTKADEFSHAAGVAVNGNDVYVSGYKLATKAAIESRDDSSQKNNVVVDSAGTSHPSKGAIAGYWKNGSFVKLTSGAVNADGSAIIVSGSDVYVAGFECNGQDADPGSDDPKKSVAKYWKNAESVALTDGANIAKATAISVNGNNVYIVGYEELGPNHLKEARYWKNGKRVNLKIEKHLTHGSDFSEANSIFVLGNDVYIAGTESGLAAYWKNGNPVKLVNRGKYQPGEVEDMIISTASSIVGIGTDIYVSGSQDTLASMNTVAKYWKNGRALSLMYSPEDLKSNVFVALDRNEPYLAYSLADKFGKRTARIWSNGHTLALSNGVTQVNSLLIVKRSR